MGALGISQVVGGLFVTGRMAARPEAFATWSVARSGQVTPAVTSVIGDHAVTSTLSFVPLAIVGVRVEDRPLFLINLAGVALVAVLYAAFLPAVPWRRETEHGLARWQVFALVAVVPAWALTVALWIVR